MTKERHLKREVAGSELKWPGCVICLSQGDMVNGLKKFRDCRGFIALTDENTGWYQFMYTEEPTSTRVLTSGSGRVSAGRSDPLWKTQDEIKEADQTTAQIFSDVNRLVLTVAWERLLLMQDGKH